MSMSSAFRWTKRNPRQRSCARRHNNDSSAPARAARHAHAHACEHVTNQVQAPIDVAADQELLGRPPLELHSLCELRRVLAAARRYASAASAGRPALASALASPSLHVGAGGEAGASASAWR